MGMVEKYGDELYTLLSKIWGYAETGFEEFQSAEVMKAFLAEHGFAVESPVWRLLMLVHTAAASR